MAAPLENLSVSTLPQGQKAYEIFPFPVLRIVSDHGVEGRYPFLDESVVSYLNSLKVNEKCDLRLPRGLGEKLLLRLLAFKLGLRQVNWPKRFKAFSCLAKQILL